MLGQKLFTFAQVRSTLLHSPGSQLLRLLSLQEPKAGVETCSSLWTLPVTAAMTTGASWPLIPKAWGTAVTAALSKYPCGRDCL